MLTIACDVSGMRKVLLLASCSVAVIFYVGVQRKLTAPDSPYPVKHEESPKTLANRSWYMEYRVIHQPALVSEDRPVLVMVSSTPTNVDRRNEIRKTWGSWPHARVLFIVGVPVENREKQQKEIEKEVNIHGDMVQIDFADTYRNLTLKSSAIVMWATENSWPDRKLVIKADDDICVDMTLLHSHLAHFGDGVYGFRMENMRPLRCLFPGCHRWELSYADYADSTFPPYAYGPFYIITESALVKMREYLFVPRFLFLENIYLTGLVSRAANISVHALPETAVMDVGARHVLSFLFDFWKTETNVLIRHPCNIPLHEFWTHTLKKRV